MVETIRVSSLGKTWILDLDGTIVKHNGYKLDGQDTFLPGAEDFLNNIPPEDMVIFVTSRTQKTAVQTEEFLTKHHVRYRAIIYNAPYGERILINDQKPSGLRTALAINVERDQFINIVFEADETL